MPNKWYNANVVDMQYASPTTKRIWLKPDMDETFHFIPGQFVTMDLPTGTKRLNRWRSYSLANTPNPENLLEFCIP